MVFKNPYWDETTKIELLQNWIIVHSMLYYEYDTSVVPDSVYDANSLQLVKKMQKYPKAASKSRYAYCFKGFDGSTGFDIPGKLNKADRKRFYYIINCVLKTNKER